jgi:subtilisin family serine protease
MIDGGVAAHPALAGTAIEQKGFAGSVRPSGHGTAVASLLAGSRGPFRGVAQGASLAVADVYSGDRAAGSASVIVRALSWLVAKRPYVINVSLVGPPNRLLEAAVRSVQERRIHLVAAVGNDGPASPPQYPASYAGVIAVTGVDARGRALPEASSVLDLDFAAPGADMAAAAPGSGYVRVRGTSFAAPLAAGRLALLGSPDRLAAEATPGVGRVGRGIVCGKCRIDPARLKAR